MSPKALRRLQEVIGMGSVLVWFIKHSAAVKGLEDLVDDPDAIANPEAAFHQWESDYPAAAIELRHLGEFAEKYRLFEK